MQFIQTNRLCIVILILFLFGGTSCVRIIIDTTGQKASEALPYSEQTMLELPIYVSQFEKLGAKLTIEKTKEILDHASLVARCGEGNDEDDCSQFPDMQNDFACKINFKPIYEVVTQGLTSFDPGVKTSPVPSFDLSSSTTPTSRPASVFHPLDCDKDGVICSDFDLEKIWGANPAKGIKVVKDILFCEDIFGEWAGCADIGENFIATKIFFKEGNPPSEGSPEELESLIEETVENIDIAFEGVLWLHEFGHTKDLYHTNDPLARNNHDNSAVMYPDLDTISTKLSSQECFRLREGIP